MRPCEIIKIMVFMHFIILKILGYLVLKLLENVFQRLHILKFSLYSPRCLSPRIRAINRDPSYATAGTAFHVEIVT